MQNHSLTYRSALTILASILTFAPMASFAGPQYVDDTGYAASGYDVVAFRSLVQKPVGESQPSAIPGQASITAKWNGATWAFSTRENRDRFLSNPDYYAPAYDGHCAYGASLNGKVPANPHLWRIVDDRLFLNVTEVVVGLWEEDIDGGIRKADTHWQVLAKKPATRRKVPELDTSRAPSS